MTVISPEIGTDRLRLRPCTMADLDDLTAIRSRPDVVRYLYQETQTRQGDIGFVFHPAYHGKSYAFEAAREMLRLGFERVGFHRIEGRCDARNGASARLMERLGMRREVHFVENAWFKREWGSELVYAILAREWRAAAS
jgi:RimJ/RimL family protein N-acetyltransferase